MKKRKILFISPKPEMNESFRFSKIFKTFFGNMLPINAIPLSLIYLATLTPETYDKRFLNASPKEVVKKISKANNFPDIACITISSCESKSGYKIADYLRKKGATVIIGGIHASMMPDEAEKHADSILIGEAEEVWYKIIKDYENKRLKKIYQSKSNKKHITLQKKRICLKEFGIFNSCLETTRGCPRNCSFCSVTSLYGSKIKHKRINEVIDEIKLLKKHSLIPGRLFFFIDDNIIIDKKYAKELFKALIPLKIKWFAQADISIASDDELLELTYKSGCRFLFIGFESVSQKALNEAGKNVKSADYANAVSKIKQKGIKIMGSFVIGFDSDNMQTINENIKFCIKSKIDFPAFSILVPYPGTRLFKELHDKKRIIDYDWEHYTKRAVFKTKNFKHGDLEKIILSTHKKFYSPRKLIKRIYQLKFKEKLARDEIPMNIMLFIAIYISNYLRPKAMYKKHIKKLR